MQKIVIFTSIGGGGHMSASNALTGYLKDQYEIKQVCLLNDLLKSFDPIRLVTGGNYTGEGTYNALTPYNQWWLMNLIYRAGRIYFAPLGRCMRTRIIQYLREVNADLVISVIPIFNKWILEAAQELDIPFLLMPTDLDLRSFIYHVHSPQYDKFHLSAIFNDPAIQRQLASKKFSKHQVSFDGFPLRPEFFQSYSRVSLCSTMGLDPEVPVIMIMMGAQGGRGLVDCVEHIRTMSMPLQLLVCIGKNQAIREPLKAIALDNNISMHIIEDTPDIAEYMAVADLLISKSGTASFCEAIHMKLPMIIDATGSALVWERFNHEFAQRRGIGFVMQEYKQLPFFIESFLASTERREAMQLAMARLCQKNAPERIKKHVARLLGIKRGPLAQPWFNPSVYG